MGKILIGTSSWTDPTLIASKRFYPSSAKTAEARLRFYATQFSLVEVDSTYYGMPAESTAGLWVNRTPDNFIFDIKAFRLLTFHQTSPLALPRELRMALPQELQHRSNFYYRDVPPAIVDEVWRQFEQALLPLDSAGKLGVVLFQFPPWFFPGDEQRDHILQCQKKLSQYRLAIEFRHGSWVNEKNIDRTMRFLRDNNLIYVCVDEPQGLKSSVPPVTAVTSDISVVRFHGRNVAAWERPGTDSASGRFNYLYSREELQPWAPKIRELAGQEQQMHVLFNNCNSDKAVTNARDLALMLD